MKRINKSLKIFFSKKKIEKSISEDYSIVNLYEYKSDIELIKYIKICVILEILLLFIFVFINIIYKLVISKMSKEKKVNTQYIFVTENNENIIFSKIKDFLPKISLEKKNITSLSEIFNSRELYINNTKLSGQYIRYLRPIDEIEEEKYKKRYSQEDTIINIDEFKKRKEKYSYVQFAQLCLQEKLIDNNSFVYDNKPLISVVIPSYNKGDFLIKSIRSIQNQDFKNIEIIIVDDCSKDNSTEIFKYLLKTDPRIRVFHHLTNMGLWRTRIDGILYSRAKYIILFDVGDLYSDNYILSDIYKIIDKYNLDSVKFFFRKINSYDNLLKAEVPLSNLTNSKIIYEPSNIEEMNNEIYTFLENIRIRLARANIFIKGLSLLNDNVLNLYKNMWDDKWFNTIINKVSNSFYIFDRIGYIYLQNGLEAGSPISDTVEEKDNKMREWISFLYFDYIFLPKESDKKQIIDQLKLYNNKESEIQLNFITSKFYVLNDLLKLLIEDSYVKRKDKIFLEGLLEESKKREKINNPEM